MKACLLPKMSIFRLRREGIRERENGEVGGWGKSAYSREAIILNISVKEDDYSREAINRGTAIIRGNTVSVNLQTVIKAAESRTTQPLRPLYL